MRAFSKEEKLIMSNLIKSKVLLDEGMILFDRFLEDGFFGGNFNKSILADASVGEVLISIDSKDVNVCRAALVEITTLSQLLIELESNGYVSFIGSDTSKKVAIGNQHSNGVIIELPSYLSLFINKKMGSLLLPSASLKEFVKNDFKSEEQRRHTQTMCVACVALFLSVAFGVLGLLK